MQTRQDQRHLTSKTWFANAFERLFITVLTRSMLAWIRTTRGKMFTTIDG